ncbi:TenA family transcriptional regulator [Nonomuraea sp. K274]|uniref:TenA family transcriptional regulator n=1 Tax=Nonomuraea cypriaca TaxID=1187855 RepID=A0A931F523_9ACTN|nr:TenA family transcriptional regulator [Nonomuraea cypriaca]MBF8194285.1 TenA family transcriptional regulator [Nonomuraea cypriaca]
MLHEELMEIRDPVLRKVQDHPFWSGLRDGSLPGEALAYFVQQDTGFLLPAYARALARCAAAAPEDADAFLLAQSVTGTLEAKDRLRAEYTRLAGELGLPELGEQLPVDPGPHAHASFFAAATARSFYAGLGALLPMVWFNAEVSDNLKRGGAPGSRYLPWIEVYHPGESYRYAVQAFLDMVDRAGETCSAAERRLIVEQFSTSIRYEWAFADCCLRQPSWPV